MGNSVTLTNVNIAGNPTFFPHTDPSKHLTLVTAIENIKTSDGRDLRNEYTLAFWGKYAQIAALYLEKGRAINVQGRLRTRSIDTGRVKANGKREIYRITTVQVDKFEFGRDSMKALSARVNANIQKAKAEGLLPPNCTITAEYLLKVEPKPFVEYNPAIAAQTGLYGNARVFVKGQGFLGPQNASAAAPVATPAAAGIATAGTVNNTTINNATIEALQAQIQAMQQQLQAQGSTAPAAPATNEGAAAVDPFSI